MKTITCSTCNKKHKRPPSKLGGKMYCNNACRWNERIVWIGWIIQNRGLRPAQMALHIGLPDDTMRTWIHYINKMLVGYTVITHPKGPVKMVKPDKVKNERKPYACRAKRPEKPKPIPLAQNNTIRLKSPNLESLGNRAPLPGSKPIYIAENNRVVTEVIPTYRGYILKHEKY